MAIVSTGLSVAGLRGDFFNRMAAIQTFWQELSTRVPSTKDSETYKWLGTVPNMREWGTGRLAKGLRTESYSVENMKYEATLEVDRDEINDDQTGQIRIRVGELAERAATHKEYLIEQLLNNGGASGYNSYDGVTFFNDTHASGASGNQDNDLTFAAADGTSPTSTEFKGAVAQATAAMMAFKDDRGEAMRIRPSGLAVIVPPIYYTVAVEAMTAAMLGGTSNVIATLAGSPRVICLPGLSTTTMMYVLKTDSIVRPLIFQDREPITFDSIVEGSEEAFKREKFLYGVRARYRMTYGYWKYAIRTTFS